MFLRFGRLDGAHVHDDTAGSQGFDNVLREQDVPHNRAILKHQNDDIRTLRGLMRRIRNARAEWREGFGLLAGAVPNRERMASIEQPLGLT
jgi:23S rRNA A2030 N6-methylase RlmJ